jgi:hypothetical protein
MRPFPLTSTTSNRASASSACRWGWGMYVRCDVAWGGWGECGMSASMYVRCDVALGVWGECGMSVRVRVWWWGGGVCTAHSLNLVRTIQHRSVQKIENGSQNACHGLRDSTHKTRTKPGAAENTMCGPRSHTSHHRTPSIPPKLPTHLEGIAQLVECSSKFHSIDAAICAGQGQWEFRGQQSVTCHVWNIHRCTPLHREVRALACTLTDMPARRKKIFPDPYTCIHVQPVKELGESLGVGGCNGKVSALRAEQGRFNAWQAGSITQAQQLGDKSEAAPVHMPYKQAHPFEKLNLTLLMWLPALRCRGQKLSSQTQSLHGVSQ